MIQYKAMIFNFSVKMINIFYSAMTFKKFYNNVFINWLTEYKY